MPYKSEKQRAYLHAKHPEIAKRWDAEYGGKVVKSNGSKAKSEGKARSRGKVRRSR